MSDDENYEEELSVNESVGDVEENIEDVDDVVEDVEEDVEEDLEEDVEDVDDVVEEDVEEDMNSQNGYASDADSIPEKTTKNQSQNQNKNEKALEMSDYDDDDEEEDDDPYYLQKFNTEINRNYLEEAHPECVANNYDEISALTTVVRDSNNNVIDPLHRTIPYLTKYEKTRILGYRAKQINSGSRPFVKVPENMIDGYLVAQIELAQKRIPFILRRPIPGGGCEYWNLKDLEIIGF